MRANASKSRQTRTNASKRRGENASKRKQTRANVDKRKQTLTPPFIAVFYTPLCNPLSPDTRCESPGHLSSGGGTSPESCPSKTCTFDDFCRISVERGLFQGLLELQSGKKKGTQTQTFWSGYSSGRVGFFHVKGGGRKKFCMSLETQKTILFGGISRDFGGIFRGCPKSLRKSSLCSTFCRLETSKLSPGTPPSGFRRFDPPLSRAYLQKPGSEQDV